VMNPVKVSVIVPVYNAGGFIAACLQSLVDQQLREIEIIVVNDGSEDYSKNVIESFLTRDERIIFIDAANEGVSAARNKALARATGKYIGFVDADDWVDPAMFKKMYADLEAAQAELAVCNVSLVEKGQAPVIRLTLANAIINVEGHEERTVKEMMAFTYDYSIWNKLYLRAILSENNIQFDQQIKIGEDLLFNLMYLKWVKRIVTLSDCYYGYNVHSNSVMHQRKWEYPKAFNQIFISYKSFASQYGLGLEWQVFNYEISRIFYYQVINEQVGLLKQQGGTFLSRVKALANMLHELSPGLFSFPATELKGLQGLKKKLLLRGKFRLFSLIVS
jgi:glycosyltransferase involved in cell wall biosynthesis